MAKLLPNAALATATGRIGNIIFRKHFGNTIVQLQPAKSELPATAAQEDRRQRFREAMNYAKKVLKDPLQQEHYRKLATERRCPPNSLLISSFLTPPSVDRIEDASYQGKPGDLIKVLASDDIEVVAVKVAIRDVAGVVLEQGPAAKIHGIWVYTAMTATTAGQPLVIEATAVDRPGNQAKLAKVRT